MSALDLGRSLPKKTCIFSWPARVRLLPITEKRFISENKKHFPSYVFLLVFFVALINFLKIGRKFFYFVALNNFFRNLSNIFFIWLPLLTFPKVGCFF